MKPEIFKSLGTTKQTAYVQRLEEINRQKQALIVELEGYQNFHESVSCLFAEGVEFMNKIELYNAMKEEWHTFDSTKKLEE